LFPNNQEGSSGNGSEWNCTNIDIRIPDCFLDVAVIIGGPVVKINIYLH
jgi:hypothetical protein